MNFLAEGKVLGSISYPGDMNPRLSILGIVDRMRGVLSGTAMIYYSIEKFNIFYINGLKIPIFCKRLRT